ncbi:MAG: DUF3373 domain-containing protein [Deltaproteobacteria bacterium]|nr:MAG: DUF3373 domain-containing protein [Deltaproteobacteria bacterium]RLB78109.1 MAG: DUF3373 domain-containing protein [Deltaproteobacteria bacterium]
MSKSIVLFLSVLLLMPSILFAATAPTIEELQMQIAEIAEELEDLSDRLEVPERHSALDRISFSGDLRSTVDSIHYKDVSYNPGMKVDMSGMGMGIITVPLNGQDQKPRKYDIDNDAMYTTRLRLNMKAKIASNMKFNGRLSMYKNWGDSTTTQVFDSWDSFSIDGTNSGRTSGDWLRVERAFFDWTDIGGSDFYLSIGRRPSTDGPPGNFRLNELRGGTPSGHLVNFNFDGFTVGYHLDRMTGIEGQTIRFCYGQGFEAKHGNGELYDDPISKNLEDTQLGGFNIDLFNDGKTFIQSTFFRAQDVVDGFKGEFAFPTQLAAGFAPHMYPDMQDFPNMNFNVRYTPSTTIGDINLAALGFTREEDNGFVWFGSVAMTQLRPNGKAGLFGGMGSDAVYTMSPGLVPGGFDPITGQPIQVMDGTMDIDSIDAEHDKNKEGYGVYVGMRMPAPMGKFGLEYNYGSKYWTPFTQAQDDLVGAKLSARGSVGEVYYIFDINPRAFIKVGALYYDYKYTGSGSPVGQPYEVDDIQDGKEYSLLPAIDKAWDAYAKITMQF